MALGVVSSNPPPLVDILPDSHESGIFLPVFLSPPAAAPQASQSVRFSNTR